MAPEVIQQTGYDQSVCVLFLLWIFSCVLVALVAFCLCFVSVWLTTLLVASYSSPRLISGHSGLLRLR
jgi:hypothetical protein